MYNADWSENVLLAVNTKSKCIYTCKYTHLQPSAHLSVIHGQWSNLLHQLGLWVTVFHSTMLIHLPSNVTRAQTRWAGLHCGILSYESLWSVCHLFTRNSYFPSSAVMVSCEGWNVEPWGTKMTHEGGVQNSSPHQNANAKVLPFALSDKVNNVKSHY